MSILNKVDAYLTEKKPVRNKFATAYLKFANKSLNDVDNSLRTLKKEAKTLEKKMGQTGSFNSAFTLIGQIIGLTQTVYDETLIAIENMEYDEANK